MTAVRLPTVLRSHAGGAAVVEAGGETVAEVLDWLEGTYPGLAGQLRTPEGAAHRFVNVYVDDDDVRYLDGLATKVGEGSEISILPAVAGG
ncbi:MAG: MoaD/ThiS family protein [Acidimicrobiales bacterium]